MKKPYIIAVCNSKGGVGKTTTVANVAAILARLEKKVLVINIDHQNNLERYLGYTPDDGPNIADLLIATAQEKNLPDAAFTDAVRHSDSWGIDFIPSDIILSRADTVFANAYCREQIFSRVLSRIPLHNYDYVLVDCAPSLGCVTTNVIFAVDGILIPANLADFSSCGINDLLDVVKCIAKYRSDHCEPKIIGILPTMVCRTTACREEMQKMQQQYGDAVMTQTIRFSADAEKSARAHIPVVAFAGGKMKHSKLADDYMAVTNELLARLE